MSRAPQDLDVDKIVRAVKSFDEAGRSGRPLQVNEGSRATGVVHESVYARLCDALVTGQIEPGRALSVRRLASEFGVSTMPAREAIHRLTANGALQMTDTRRVRVADMTTCRAAELRIARLAIEPVLAVRALEVVDARDDAADKQRLVRSLRKIDADLVEAVRQGDAEQYTRYNNAYHFTLYRAANSDVLMRLVESLWLQVGPFMRVVIGRLGTRTFSRNHHVRAIDAFEQSDADRLADAISDAICKSMDVLVAAGERHASAE